MFRIIKTAYYNCLSIIMITIKWMTQSVHIPKIFYQTLLIVFNTRLRKGDITRARDLRAIYWAIFCNYVLMS